MEHSVADLFKGTGKKFCGKSPQKFLMKYSFKSFWWWSWLNFFVLILRWFLSPRHNARSFLWHWIIFLCTLIATILVTKTLEKQCLICKIILLCPFNWEWKFFVEAGIEPEAYRLQVDRADTETLAAAEFNHLPVLPFLLMILQMFKFSFSLHSLKLKKLITCGKLFEVGPAVQDWTFQRGQNLFV